VIDINSIGRFQNRRSKRVFDVLVSLALLASFPVSMFITKNPIQYLQNVLNVLIARKSISGYHPQSQHELKLPEIRKGILFPTDAFLNQTIDDQAVARLNMLYAQDYKLSNEFRLLYSGFRKLGRKYPTL
jgi:hypothetical protein